MEGSVSQEQPRTGDGPEIAYHIEELTKANIAKGMSAEEARRQASIAFGGREQIKQQLREVNTSTFLNSMAFSQSAATTPMISRRLQGLYQRK